MPEKRRRPGSPKGQPKPSKRRLDADFANRLKEAMGGMSAAELGRRVGCERATIGNYLNGTKRTVELLLFLDITGALGVDPHWLALGSKRQPAPKPLPDYLKRDRRVAESDRRGNGSHQSPILHQPRFQYRKESPK